jgi:tRNA (guanosine-2'-O-)-methyltransferase
VSAELEARSIDPETLDRIISTLEPFLTLERLTRIDQVLAARSRGVVLALEDIANEHNGAAVLRTADAFGFFEVHVIEPAEGRFKISKRISKGADKWLDLQRHERAEEAYGVLRRRGYKLYASTLHGDAIDVSEIPVDAPIAIVFGNELLGLSPQAISGADGYFRVPMSGFVESFNISVAVAITCYDLSIRRRAAGIAPGLEPDDLRRVRATWLTKSLKSAPQILDRAGLPVPALHRNAFVQVGEDVDG